MSARPRYDASENACPSRSVAVNSGAGLPTTARPAIVAPFGTALDGELDDRSDTTSSAPTTTTIAAPSASIAPRRPRGSAPGDERVGGNGGEHQQQVHVRETEEPDRRVRRHVAR